VLLFAVDADVRLCNGTDGCGVVQGLEQGVGIRVENVRLETRVLGAVVESKVKVFDAELGVLDLDLAVVLWYLAGGCLRAQRTTGVSVRCAHLLLWLHGQVALAILVASESRRGFSSTIHKPSPCSQLASARASIDDVPFPTQLTRQRGVPDKVDDLHRGQDVWWDRFWRVEEWRGHWGVIGGGKVR
jgi:hypothetical protein